MLLTDSSVVTVLSQLRNYSLQLFGWLFEVEPGLALSPVSVSPDVELSSAGLRAQKRIGLLEGQLAQRKAEVSALRQKLLSGAHAIGPVPQAAAQPVCKQVMSCSVPAAADVMQQASRTSG